MKKTLIGSLLILSYLIACTNNPDGSMGGSKDNKDQLENSFTNGLCISKIVTAYSKETKTYTLQYWTINGRTDLVGLSFGDWAHAFGYSWSMRCGLGKSIVTTQEPGELALGKYQCSLPEPTEYEYPYGMRPAGFIMSMDVAKKVCEDQIAALFAGSYLVEPDSGCLAGEQAKIGEGIQQEPQTGYFCEHLPDKRVEGKPYSGSFKIRKVSCICDPFPIEGPPIAVE